MSKIIDKHYVSPIDKFLEQTRQNIPESESQVQEREKFVDIGRRRDAVVEKSDDSEIWQDF